MSKMSAYKVKYFRFKPRINLYARIHVKFFVVTIYIGSILIWVLHRECIDPYIPFFKLATIAVLEAGFILSSISPAELGKYWEILLS